MHMPRTYTCVHRRVRFQEFSPEQAYSFQRNMLKTILQLETTFFELAEDEEKRNVLVVCDRGAMDPSACESMGVVTSVRWRRKSVCTGRVLSAFFLGGDRVNFAHQT